MTPPQIKSLTWREQLRANGLRLVGDLRSAFANASPLMTRAFLTLATLLAAVGLWACGDEWASSQAFDAMRSAMPRWLWALLFTIGGLAQCWRLIDDHPRLYIGILVNAHVAAMWCLAAIGLWRSGSLFVAASALAVFLQAAWLTVRTGVTNLDRRRA